MRHRKNFNHLGRKSAHRNAMLSNMAASLILHKRIETTTAKAKALRSYIEPIITKSKEDTTHSRRVVFSYLQNKEAVTELFREVAAKVHDRPGGYTRLLKLGARLGDSAEMCIIELVDFNENLLGETAAKPKAGRRRRGLKKKETEKQTVTAGTAASEKEEIKAETQTDTGNVTDAEEVVDESSNESLSASQPAEEDPDTATGSDDITDSGSEADENKEVNK